MQDSEKSRWLAAVLKIWHMIDKEGIPATIEGWTALALQGCPLPDQEDPHLQVSVQWDAMPSLYQKMQHWQASTLITGKSRYSFTFSVDQFHGEIIARLGTVIRTDPDRIVLDLGNGRMVAVKSLNYYMRILPKNDTRRLAVKQYLQCLQNTDAGANGAAWNHEAYQAWINRFGVPELAAEKIQKDPEAKLGALAPYFQDVEGKAIINLLGSHASKAIALALMGARVTVVDISAENAAYAKKVADALHLWINYIVSDVLQLSLRVHQEKYDYVFMELGVLHYFVDLEPLAELVFHLLKPGGQFVIQEFHPISTKLITTHGKKQVVFGNYFDQTLKKRQIAFSKHLPADPKHTDGEQGQQVFLREWTLSEIVTAFAEAGLTVQRLEESPNMKIADIGLPKLFILACRK